MPSSLPYHEPPIQTILIQSSFLLVLNAVNHVFDYVIYSGLVGQIIIGIAWGMPGGKLLDAHTQEVIVQLGYIGLIALVFEGGLSTSFSALKANLGLSILVALTGIAVPMGLSFILSPMVGATSLQAFAAGAALCSTSLGTTFTLLSTSGLSATRLGVVLTSAAMMDDVIGLIMVQVISNLGASSSFDVVTVIRPILVSLAFAVLLPLACRFVVLPLTKLMSNWRQSNSTSLMGRFVAHELFALSAHTLILAGTVAGATYAGSSALLGAYIAGAMISWWDAEAPHPVLSSPSATTTETEPPSLSEPSQEPSREMDTNDPPSPSHNGAEMFEKYYQPALQRILKPFFFASVGFSIPVTQMFDGSIVWRGLVYTILMTLGKLVCGLWLLRVPSPLPKLHYLARLFKERVFAGKRTKTSQEAASRNKKPSEKPLSLYPGLILGCAMVSRGEIGYLISSLAESGGVFDPNEGTSNGPSDIFLIVTWAITLCTVLGPISMGFLVDRVRKLETRASSSSGTSQRTSNVLGSWGVS